jgi:hypothetical protein
MWKKFKNIAFMTRDQADRTSARNIYTTAMSQELLMELCWLSDVDYKDIPFHMQKQYSKKIILCFKNYILLNHLHDISRSRENIPRVLRMKKSAMKPTIQVDDSDTALHDQRNFLTGCFQVLFQAAAKELGLTIHLKTPYSFTSGRLHGLASVALLKALQRRWRITCSIKQGLADMFVLCIQSRDTARTQDVLTEFLYKTHQTYQHKL